jgi:hypothetical protein
MSVMVTESVRNGSNAPQRAPEPRERLLRTRTPVPSDRILPGTRAVLFAFAGFTLVAAFVLGVLTASTDRYFAWTIAAEPAAGFLGAAYSAGFVLSLLCLRRSRWSDVRVAMFTVTGFAVVTLIATFLHLHKFHLAMGGSVARLAALVWMFVYLVIPVACIVAIVRQERRRRRPEPVRLPLPAWLVALLAAQGVTLFLAGALLFAGGATRHHHVMESTAFWPLPVAPLAAQAIGAWLLAFGFAAALAIRAGDLSRLVVPAVAYAVFGALQLLTVLRYRDQITGGPWLWAYLALLMSIVVAGGYGWLSAHTRRIVSRSRAYDRATG